MFALMLNKRVFRLNQTKIISVCLGLPMIPRSNVWVVKITRLTFLGAWHEPWVLFSLPAVGACCRSS